MKNVTGAEMKGNVVIGPEVTGGFEMENANNALMENNRVINNSIRDINFAGEIARELQSHEEKWMLLPPDQRLARHKQFDDLASRLEKASAPEEKYNILRSIHELP